MRNRIRTLRRSHRWTLADLSRESGVPIATISALENRRIRKPSYQLVTALAKALGVTGAELFAPPKGEAA